MLEQNNIFYVMPQNRKWGRICSVAFFISLLLLMFQNSRDDLIELWKVSGLFAFLWQLVFVVAVLLMSGIMLWSIFGKVVLRTERRILIIEKKLFFFNWSNKFEMGKLSDLQLVQNSESLHTSLFHIMTAGAFSGGVSFCYDGIRFSILKGLNSKETTPLLHQMEILLGKEKSDVL